MGSSDSNSSAATICCNGADAVHRMVEATLRFIDRHKLAAGNAARLAIVVEELVTNLVEHGGIGEDGLVELALERKAGLVRIVLSDTGPAFDPREAGANEEIPERGGGAGIDLVRAWTEIVDYGPHAGRNRLRLDMPLS